MKSMTGFAHRTISAKGFLGSITLKSYNNRFFDLSLSIPASASGIEPNIREFLGSRISRGKIECTLRLKKTEAALDDITMNFQSAKTLTEQLRHLAQACGLHDEPSLDVLTRFPGVIELNTDIDESELWQILFPIMEETWREFEESRIREGLATQQNVTKQMNRFISKLDEIEKNAGQLEQLVHDQITARFKELLGDNYDEGRVLQELAVQLVRLTINEEIQRLKAHISAFNAIASEPACGKKLDFLCQEMNREVNTIGSKNMLVAVSLAVVEMKDALENIREQLRNVE